MPKLCRITSRQITTAGSGAKVPFLYKPFKYYRGTTEYTTDVTVNGYSNIESIYNTSEKRFGNRSMGLVSGTSPVHYIDIPISISDPTNFMVEVWFKISGGRIPLLEIYDSASTYGFSLWSQFTGFTPSSWTGGLYSRNSVGANNNGQSNMEYYGNTQITDWQHLFFVKSNLSTMFCMNGYQYNDGNFPGPWLGNARWHTSYDTIRIGYLNSSNTPGYSWAGGFVDSIEITSGNVKYGKTFVSTGTGSYNLGFTAPSTQPTPTADTIFLTNFE